MVDDEGEGLQSTRLAAGGARETSLLLTRHFDMFSDQNLTSEFS